MSQTLRRRFVDESYHVEWFSVEEILNSWRSCDGWDIHKALNRARTEQKYREAKRFLSDEGFTQPLCYDQHALGSKDMVKVQMDGHHRLAAAIDLGYTQIPYIFTFGEVFLDDIGTWDNPGDERLLHKDNFKVDFRHELAEQLS